MRVVAKRLQYAVTAGLFILTLLAGVAVFPRQAQAFSGSGVGNYSSPYLITTCSQIAEIADELSAHYRLEQDLNCSASGNAVRVMGVFEGVFDGDDHTLTINLYNDTNYEFLSLFQTANSNSSFTNLNIAGVVENDAEDPAGTAALINSGYGTSIQNVHSTVNVTNGTGPTGGLVTSLQSGVIEDVTVDASVIGGEYTGGIIAYLGCESEVRDVHFEGSISTGGSAGGIAASDSCEGDGSLIEDSSASGTIDANGAGSIGGIVGGMWYGSIRNTYADMAITDAGSNVGGLVGELVGSTINQSAAVGSVVGAGERVGGLVGSADDTLVDQSFALGDVTAGGQYAGGLVGNGNVTDITDSYARGDVSGEEHVGGFIGGFGSNWINRSYATGSVNSAGESVGGFVGSTGEAGVAHSFWDIESSGTENGISMAEGKTTAEMTNISTFTTDLNEDSWDFDETWAISEDRNDGYPCLVWSETCSGEDDGGQSGQDEDDDGISSTVENAAPNSGDGNNDGTPDSEQTHVASFVNVATGAYTTVAVDSQCSLTAISANNEDSNAVQDTEYTYVTGFVNFTADCGEDGFTTSATIYNYGVNAENVLVRKYNPNTQQYFTITDASLTQQTIGGNSAAVATYAITDGGERDIDGEENGIIVDPVGLAAATGGTTSDAGAGGSSLLARTGESQVMVGLMALLGVGSSLYIYLWICRTNILLK